MTVRAKGERWLTPRIADELTAATAIEASQHLERPTLLPSGELFEVRSVGPKLYWRLSRFVVAGERYTGQDTATLLAELLGGRVRAVPTGEGADRFRQWATFRYLPPPQEARCAS